MQDEISAVFVSLAICCVSKIIPFFTSRMKFQWRSFGYKSKVVVLCSAANFINAADRVLMPLAIVPMTSEYKWSLYWQGWILSAFAFGYFTSQVSGWAELTVNCHRCDLRVEHDTKSQNCMIIYKQVSGVSHWLYFPLLSVSRVEGKLS